MPTPRRTLTVAQLRAHLKSHAFAPGPADRVGVELELTPLATFAGRVDLDAARAGVDGLWAGMPVTPGAAAPSWRGGALSLEPGGQLEYSGDPCGTPGEAARRASRAVRGLRTVARRRGFDLVAVGLHPWASAEALGLRTPAPRYRAMQGHFDAIGPAGRRMMRLTGSLQVNLDYGSPADLRERWELAQRLAPVLAATFANSAVEAGRPATVPGLRGETWLHLDPSRAGIPAGFLEAPDSDPVDQYLAFALAALVMFVARPGGPYEVPSPPITFGAWMAEGLPAGYPDLADWRTHLSTLFPDVRAKGYVEIRSMDAPGVTWLGVPALLAGHALRDPAARRGLLDHLRPHHAALPRLRERAARLGLADPTLRDAAEFLVRAVRPRLGKADGAIVDAYSGRYVRPGRTPGEELRDLIPEGGVLDPAELFRLERDRAAAAGRRMASTAAGG